MKIIAVLEVSILTGGGFNQALNSVLQMRDLSKGRFEFSVVSTKKENINFLKNQNIEANFIRITFLDRLLPKLYSGRIWNTILSKLKIISPFEKLLIKNNCDLVYFVEQSPRAEIIINLNFIVTVWDLCHRDQLEFPEVRNFGEFTSREWVFQNTLTPAYIVLTDSEELAEKISFRYGVDRDRIIPMPFSPSHLITEASSKNSKDVLELYKLDYGYFFYPAQFWAHKNHIRIIKATKILHAEGIKCRIVFVGENRGNYHYLKKIILDNGLNNYVKSLGFIPAEHMGILYKNCQAVLMPSYFGPTNLPPLEAWFFGKPLIYSSHLSGQVHDAAILINPDDELSLANAMKSSLEKNVSEKYINNGFKRLKKITAIKKKAENQLVSKIIQFAKKRECWNKIKIFDEINF